MHSVVDQRSALTLLVLRCQDIELSRAFYECLGLTFFPERHESGPSHYSTTVGGTVLELYPTKSPATSVRFGLGLLDVAATVAAVRVLGDHVVRAHEGSALVRDPDSNLIELTTLLV